MKKWILPCVCLLFYHTASAQLGFTVAPTSGYSPDWQIVVENFVTHRRTNFLSYGVTGLIDYHIPSSRPAWSFRPAVHVMRTGVNYEFDRFDVRSIGLLGNVNFAPFLIGKDERGKHVFYFQFSPGLAYVRENYDRLVEEVGQPQGEWQRFISHRLGPNLGANVLLEIQLTQLLSIAPQAGIRYYPGLRWPGFTSMVSKEQISGTFDRTNWQHITFGLRIGLNLNKVGEK